MRCKIARKMLGDSMDGILGRDDVSRLERHLDSCTACRAVREDLLAIVRDAGRLETPAPSERVWQRISLKLDETRRVADAGTRPEAEEKRGLFGLPVFAPSIRFAAASILAAFVIAAAVLFGLPGLRRGGPAALDTSMSTTLAKLEEAQYHYRLALKALDEAIAAQKETLDPRIEQAFLGNRKAVDASVAVCEETVAGNPLDIEARNMLLSAYRQKLELLNDMMAAKKALSKKAAGPVL